MQSGVSLSKTRSINNRHAMRAESPDLPIPTPALPTPTPTLPIPTPTLT